MFPYDIASYMLFAVISISLTLYFTLLIRLKPSAEIKLSTYMKTVAEKKMQKKIRKTAKPVKVEKPTEPSLPDALEEKECPHYVGYLTTLAKGSPFPDECFGCRKVIQCLRIEPTKVIESFYMAAAETE